MTNTLDPGQTRIGFLIDGRPETPDIACMPTNTGERIELTVPFGPTSLKPYEKWFDGNFWANAPTGSEHNPPKFLLFKDHEGRVVLAGCRKTGAGSMGFVTGAVGYGKIEVAYAILDGNDPSKYARIHGLQSSIPGLAEWLNMRSLSRKIEMDQESRVTEATLLLKAPPPIKLNREMGLSIQPGFRITHQSGTDETTIREEMRIATDTSRSRNWSEHLTQHIAFLDLISLATWAPVEFHSHLVQHRKEPLRALGGHKLGPQWLTVVAPASRRSESAPPRKKLKFLFAYSDIGSAGVRKWLRLNEKFDRGITPIISSIYDRKSNIEVQMTQLAIGLEAIGYQLAIDSGLSARRAGDERLAPRIHRIIGEARFLTDELLDLDFPRKFADVYNGLKHANRTLPDPVNIANTWRKGALLFRIWAASQIGVSKKRLKETAPGDRLNDAFEAGDSI